MKNLINYILLSLCLVLIGCASKRDIIEEQVKVGMSQKEVIEILGMPTDVEEKGNRIDFIYLGRARDNFYNTRLVFIDDKYVRWQPAGYNSAGEASFSSSLQNSANATREINNQHMQNINNMNTNMQLNQINNTLKKY